MKSKNKHKNIHLQFILLLLSSLPLTLFMTYISIPLISTPLDTETETTKDMSTLISEITPPSYSLNDIEVDTDLKKFPSDYDTLIDNLGISLTQHQKTALLLFGQTVTESKHSDITQAYMELLEKNIPILIPQEYINEYLNNEISKYETTLTQKFVQLTEEINVEKDTFDNPYDEYIFKQFTNNLTLTSSTETLDNSFKVSDFLIDIDSESINRGYYKARILSALSVKTDKLVNNLNSLVIYSENKNDINTLNRLKIFLKDVIQNPKLNKQGATYWSMSVISGKTYIHPMYISEEFYINDNNFEEMYDIPPLVQSRNSVRVPILMYHHIDKMPNSNSPFVTGLYVTPEIFEEQLAYLVKKNYKSLTSQELYNLLVSGKNPSQKSVMITFDDSTKGQYTNAYPLLKKYGLVGIYYVITQRTSITYNQLREMVNNGMIIDSHSATHPDLAKESSSSRLYSEIVGSRYTLKSVTNQPVISIAYPGCVADSQAYSYVSQAGYLIGGSCGRSIDHYLSKRYSLSRVHVFNSLDNLKNILSGKY